MIRLEDRRTLVVHVDSAHQAGARLAAKAYEIVDIDARTCQHWKMGACLQGGDGRPLAERPALTDFGGTEIVSVANEPRFAARPPARIIPALADESSADTDAIWLREADALFHTNPDRGDKGE